MTQPEIVRNAIRFVCRRYGVTERQVRGKDRSEKVLWPRWVAFKLARDNSLLESHALGRAFGKDHGTIENGLRQLKNRVESEFKYRRDWTATEEAFKGKTNGNQD